MKGFDGNNHYIGQGRKRATAPPYIYATLLLMYEELFGFF